MTSPRPSGLRPSLDPGFLTVSGDPWAEVPITSRGTRGGSPLPCSVATCSAARGVAVPFCSTAEFWSQRAASPWNLPTRPLPYPEAPGPPGRDDGTEWGAALPCVPFVQMRKLRPREVE